MADGKLGGYRPFNGISPVVLVQPSGYRPCTDRSSLSGFKGGRGEEGTAVLVDLKFHLDSFAKVLYTRLSY